MVYCLSAKRNPSATGVRLIGREIEIAIEEKLKRFDEPQKEKRVTKGFTYDTGRGPYTTVMVDSYPRHGYTPLLLALRVPSYASPRLQIADGEKRRLEDVVGDFLVGVVPLAEADQVERREGEERERLRMEDQRRREELERLRIEQQARRAALEKNVASWFRAESIRAYVAAARAAAVEATDADIAHFNRALSEADRVDPLKRENNRDPK